MSVLLAIKLISLFLAILFTLLNVGKILYKQSINGISMLLWALSIFGFIVLQFELFK